MSWIAVGATVVKVGSDYYQGKKAEKAAKAVGQGYDAATEEQRRQFDVTQRNLEPFLQASQGALARQGQILAGDYSGFESSPDYTFARDQSLKSLERGAAARGGFMGGGADADRIELAGGLATQNLGNYWNRLAEQAGQGRAAATNLGQFGASVADAAGRNLIGAGNARASSYNTQGETFGNIAEGITQGFGSWYGGLNQDEEGRYLGKVRGAG